MRVASEIATSTLQRIVPVATKSSVLRYGVVLWDEAAAEFAREFPAVAWAKELVNAVTIRMVMRSALLYVIVGKNPHGDILPDIAAASPGSVGVTLSSSLDPTCKYLSMLEPVHDSAVDITGKGVANPMVALLWAAETEMGG